MTSTGTVDPAQQLTISAAGIFTISGTIKFKLQASGRVDVSIPNASVGISVPIDGTLTSAFSISGSAHFAFGGGLPFQLQSLMVNGFSIFGLSLSVPTDADAALPPTVELVSPLAGQNVRLEDLNARHYIDVMFNDVNGVGLNVASIIDSSAEFVLLGTAAEDVVLTSVAQVDPVEQPGPLPLPVHRRVQGRSDGSEQHRRGLLPRRELERHARHERRRLDRAVQPVHPGPAGAARDARGDSGACCSRAR